VKPDRSTRRIRDLLHDSPLIDGHNDLLWELRAASLKEDSAGWDLDVSRPRPELMTDLPRLEAGGVGGQFWSVYVPSDLPGHEAVTRTLEQIDALLALVRLHPDRMAIARTADDVERIAASGRVASMMGVEGGHCIGSSLGALRTLARLGAGYLTLTHNDDTPWADSATGDHPHGGLTTFGEDVVRELNRCGVLVDLSHVSDDTMRQAVDVSEAPVIFSHSSARALCDVPRDVPDDVLELVGRTGGVVMVTFVPAFIASEGAGATASDVADHVQHIHEIAGIDALGVGSDFDGAPSMPDGLEDVSTYPALFGELAARGYADEDLMKIAGRNVLRVMRDAERVAARSG
jgi:membrane dipeptidase